MTFKVLALVFERFLHLYWISYCKKRLVSKGDIFTPFCYKFIQVTACKKVDIVDLSLIKLSQNQQECNLMPKVFIHIVTSDAFDTSRVDYCNSLQTACGPIVLKTQWTELTLTSSSLCCSIACSSCHAYIKLSRCSSHTTHPSNLHTRVHSLHEVLSRHWKLFRLFVRAWSGGKNYRYDPSPPFTLSSTPFPLATLTPRAIPFPSLPYSFPIPPASFPFPSPFFPCPPLLTRAPGHSDAVPGCQQESPAIADKPARR